jgi:hypothetical protein
MMRRAAVVLALVTLVFTARSSAQNGAGSNFVTGQILVKFRPGIAASVQADAHRQAGGQQIAEISRTRIQLVSVAAGDERGAIARYLRAESHPSPRRAVVDVHVDDHVYTGGNRGGPWRLLLQAAVGAPQHGSVVLLHPVD